MTREQKIGELPDHVKAFFKEMRKIDKEQTKTIRGHFNSGGTILELRKVMNWCHYSDDTIRLLVKSYLSD